MRIDHIVSLKLNRYRRLVFILLLMFSLGKSTDEEKSLTMTSLIATSESGYTRCEVYTITKIAENCN